VAKLLARVSKLTVNCLSGSSTYLFKNPKFHKE
jgi:hypothetical protein